MNKVTTLFLLGVLMGGVARGQANPCKSANHHCVVLTWLPSSTPGIAGYNIFRGTEPRKESSTPLNASPLKAGCEGQVLPRHHHRGGERYSGPSCTWTDNNVQAGVTYYYYITAVAAGGVMQSAASREAKATVPRNAQ